jgi:hypothetical protein
MAREIRVIPKYVLDDEYYVLSSMYNPFVKILDQIFLNSRDGAIASMICPG